MPSWKAATASRDAQRAWAYERPAVRVGGLRTVLRTCKRPLCGSAPTGHGSHGPSRARCSAPPKSELFHSLTHADATAYCQRRHSCLHQASQPDLVAFVRYPAERNPKYEAFEEAGK
eukprot:scaffold1382_cov429-Prasinococcus_capsulatus_cf.AAC.9